MAAVTVILIALSTVSSPAEAGVNEGGMLILHANPSLVFTAGMDYMGYSELYDCENAITRVDGVEGEIEEIVYFVIAAFDSFTWPRVRATSFGIRHTSPLVEPFAWGTNAMGYVEYPGWPASETGIAVIWREAQTSQMLEVCWFASYAYPGNVTEIIEHPSQGWPVVGDDSLPMVTDRVEWLGKLGFGRDGHNPCGGHTVTGACCTPQGRCIVQTRSTCEAFGYVYHGDNTACWPNPCVPGEGACCLGLDCRLLKWDECLDAGGVFMGEGISCIPSPCEFSQIETSWSRLKTIYR